MDTGSEASVPASRAHAEWVRETFAAVSPRYDLLNHCMSLGLDILWRARTARLARPSVPGPVLDLCTGTGDLAFAFERATESGREVVGLDFCEEMLVLARRKAERRDSRVSFRAGDAMKLPLADASAAVISIAFGLRNLASPEAGMREMARVAAPGGKVAVLEFSLPKSPPMRSAARFYLAHVVPVLGEVIAGQGEAYRYLAESVVEFAETKPVGPMMAAAGLEVVGEHAMLFGIAGLTLGRKP